MKYKSERGGGGRPADAAKIARMWPDFVGIEKRMEMEAPFIKGHARAPNPLVLDACLGCGATTIGLRLNGIDNVVSNEIDREMLKVAVREASKRRVDMHAVSYDWRELASAMGRVLGRFDVVACLGNSLTLLFDRNERLEALRNFASLLSADGALIIDERNYPEILKGNFRWSGDYVYCGIDKVACAPVRADDGMVVMEYRHLQRGDRVEYRMYPFKSGEMAALLREAGFGEIETYGDYYSVYHAEDVEFFTHVARK